MTDVDVWSALSWRGLNWRYEASRSSDREDVYVLARYGFVYEDDDGNPVVDIRLRDGWDQPPAREPAPPPKRQPIVVPTRLRWIPPLPLEPEPAPEPPAPVAPRRYLRSAVLAGAGAGGTVAFVLHLLGFA